MAKKTANKRNHVRSRKKIEKRVEKKEEGLFYENRYEIGFVIVTTISILLCLANFGIAGAIGTFMKGVEFGLFGFWAWLLPFYLFFMMLFNLANKGNKRAKVKSWISLLLLFIVSAIAELVSNGNVASKNWGDFYLDSAEKYNGGGLVGGIFAKIFTSGLALTGSYIVFISLFLILCMILTGRVFTSPINRRMAETRDGFLEYREEQREVSRQRAEEKSERRKEIRIEKREERERLREEKRERLQQLKEAEEAERLEKERLLREEEEREERAREEREKILREKIEKAEREQRERENLNATNAEIELKKIGSEKKKDFPLLIQEVMQEPSLGEGYYKDLIENKFGDKTEEVENNVISEETSDHMKRRELSWNLVSKNEEEKAERIAFLEESFKEKAMEEEFEKEEFEAEELEEEEFKEEDFKEEDFEREEFEEEDFEEDISLYEQLLAEEEAVEAEEEREELQKSDLELEKQRILQEKKVVQNREPMSSFEEKKETKSEGKKPIIPEKKEEEKKPYFLPPLSLLEKADQKEEGVDEAELRETAEKLQKTLEAFGVRAKITEVSCGPSVTRYELQPEIGVKVSRITSLADDIKLNLAAADIRIEAPIPGKAAVGIEVPNKKNMMVYFRELIEHKAFTEQTSKLSFAVGKDIGGKTMVTDIAKMPHLLIAGATGSGKSVCINTLIMSILYEAKPDEVKFIMIDPKVVELSCYNGIPHLLLPVVTDPKKAAAALNWAVAEMNRRYGLFAEKGVRNIKGFNKTVGKESEEWMPQIVIIVDELADLMMVSSKDVEEAICRLAQLARAAGIHLVIATQRPSVNVITGLIKANIPSRIAFAVSSQVDSRTILDGAGAEKLLGKGDMLFFPSGYPKPIRVQGAFISDEEVSNVVEFIRENNGENHIGKDITEEVNAVISAEATKDAPEKGQGEEPEDEYDEYFDEAGKLVIKKQKASIGMLQRVYRIGFNRAARIMDQLAETGVVSEEDGTRPRKVLMEMEEFVKFLAIRHGEDPVSKEEESEEEDYE